MKTSLKWCFTLALVALVAFAVPADAQTTKGSISGTAMDNDNKPLPGVTVTLTGGGAPRTAVTGADGKYRFLSLDPGTYQLTAQLDGFSTVEYPSVRVELNLDATINIVLSPAIEETITVTSETPLLDERKITAGATITAVELEKIPTARDPWSVLNQSPGVLTDRVNVGGNESGQQSIFIAAGRGFSENNFQVDGVQITDMAALGASPTYYDFEQFESIEVNTGSTDVTNNAAGVTMNMVTKRGTNEFRGSARILQSRDSFFGDVFTQGETSLSPGDLGPNQTSFSPRKVEKAVEYGVEAGGPIIEDKLWLWGSYGTNDIEQVNFGGGDDDTILENYSAKLNWQVTDSNSALISHNVGDKLKFGRGAGTTRPDETTWNQRGPSDITKFEDSHIFSSNFYLTGTFSQVRLGFALFAKGGVDGSVSPHLDSGAVWRNTYWSGFSQRPGEEAKIDGNYFFNTGDINHELKFGARNRTLENASPFFWPGDYRSLAGNLLGLPAGQNRVDFFQDSNFLFDQEYTSWWVQDTISRGNWTVNVGIRSDVQEGFLPADNLPAIDICDPVASGDPRPCDLLTAVTGNAVDPPFEWEDITPRIGVTYALGPDRKTLLRASYSQYPAQLGADFTILSQAASKQVRYIYEELGGPTPGYNSGFDQLLSLQRVIGGGGADNPNRIDPGLDAPLTESFSVSVEHAFLPEFVVGANISIGETSDILEFRDLWEDSSGQLITPGRSQYIQTGTIMNTLPNGQSVSKPVFSVNPALGLVDTGGVLWINGPRSVESTEFGLQFTKRLANRWMARGYVSFNESEWNVPDSYFDNQDPNIVDDRGDVDGEIFFVESSGSGRGNIFLNAEWNWNLTGMYQVAPDRRWGFNVSANLYGRQGYPVPYFDTTTAADGFVREISLTENDAFRVEDIFTTDLRLEKEFAASGNVSLTFGFDIFNVFDESYILAREPDLGAGNADEVQDVLSPRVFRLGVRLNWR